MRYTDRTMQTTFATPAVYKKGVVFPRFKPKTPPQEVVVVYISAKEQNGSKKKSGKNAFIEQRLEEGLKDLKEGRGIGPFSTVEESMKALLE